MLRILMTSLCAVLLLGAPAHAQEYTGQWTKPLTGWVQFCKDHPSEQGCDPSRGQIAGDTSVLLTKERMNDLEEVYSVVMENARFVSDRTLYGKLEHWAYPQNGKGDCEDFVLLWRRMLVERGFPPHALRPSLLQDENGEGHAVLAVVSKDGQVFILDIRSDKVLNWNERPRYHWYSWMVFGRWFEIDRTPPPPVRKPLLIRWKVVEGK